MKRMLINASHTEEMRVAMVDGQRLYDLDIENRTREQKKSNIYKGKITRVEPSLEAAFVDYGAERHGFLPLKEISREYFKKKKSDGGRTRIIDAVQEGQEVVVQVEKEERGSKGAALTTFISLAGRYLVLMPNNPRAGGISRRIEGEDRADLREAMRSLEIPDGMGAIVRTAGIGRAAEELQWDLDYLLQLWDTITTESENSKAPHFLFQESNVIVRAIRDYLRQDVGEVVVDNEEAHALAATFIGTVMPDFKSKVKYYQDEIPLFNRYQIENQIQTAFQREVALPSGGSIVIDVTEAMVSIDINSSRATKGGDIEETAFNINLEAAEEIARQLRLRDVGGLIVIDFIDMLNSRHQKAVENKMRDALEIDRARVQVGRISRFGLMEMSRQRLRPSLEETMSKICPRCNGQGTIRGTRSLALSILRLVEEEAQKEYSREIRAIVPVPVATFLLNEKRLEITAIESRNKIKITVLPNTEMETPNFEVVRIRTQDEDDSDYSYKMADELSKPDLTIESDNAQSTANIPTPAVKTIAPATPAPVVAPKKKSPGLVKRLWASMFGDDQDKQSKPAKKSRSNKRGSQQRRGKHSNQRTNSRNNDNKSRRGDKAASNMADNNARKDNKNSQRNNDNRPKKRRQQKEAPTKEATSNTNTAAKASENSAESKSGIKRRPDDRRRGPRRRRNRQEVPQELLNNNPAQPSDSVSESQTDKATPAPAKDVEQQAETVAPKKRRSTKPAADKQANTEAATTEAVVTTSETNAAASSPQVEESSDTVKPKRKRRTTKPKQDKVENQSVEADSKDSTDTKAKTETETAPVAKSKPKAKAKAKAKPKAKAKAAPKPKDSAADTKDAEPSSESSEKAPAETADSNPKRASNDPRNKPKTVKQVEVSSEGRKSKKAPPVTSETLDTTPVVKPAVKRAANDPRQKRAVTAETTIVETEAPQVQSADNNAEKQEKNSPQA
jgi:ribonuclease E